MRVVHPKLSDRTILGCYQLLEAKGLAVAGKPMTTVVTTVLTSLIDNMQSQSIIEDITDGDAEDKLNAIIGDIGKIREPAPSIAINPLGDIDESLLLEEDGDLPEEYANPDGDLPTKIHKSLLHKENMQELPEDILKDVRGIHDPLPTIEDGLDQPELEEEPIEVKTSIPPWEIIPGMKKFSEIKEECPLDRFVELADTKDSDILRHCVEIVYHTLPLIDWGSTKAEKLIKDTLPIVSKYFE